MTLGELFRRGEKAAGPEWSTYEELNEAPNWSHYGVGRRAYIPSVALTATLNGFYFLFIVAIALGMRGILTRYAPWMGMAAVVFLAMFIYRVKARWENILVHRVGIWWSPDKVLLGELLCDEDETREEDFSLIHAAAERFRQEGLQALKR